MQWEFLSKVMFCHCFGPASYCGLWVYLFLWEEVRAGHFVHFYGRNDWTTFSRSYDQEHQLGEARLELRSPYCWSEIPTLGETIPLCSTGTWPIVLSFHDSDWAHCYRLNIKKMEQRQYQCEQKTKQNKTKTEWSVFETSVSVLNFIFWNNFRFTEKLQTSIENPIHPSSSFPKH